VNFPIFLNGDEQIVSGTSGSAPIVAGIISLLNDYLISEGRPPLGFLNLWLYGGALSGFGFNDITSGWNLGCKNFGFPAIPGWDPVTGLGTLDFERLRKTLIWNTNTTSYCSGRQRQTCVVAYVSWGNGPEF
jgi:tripeptidyl-peptidase-1